MAVQFFTGFEAANELEALDAGGSGSNVQNTVARNSGYALECAATTTGTAYSEIGGLAATGAPAKLSLATAYIRFYFRFATKPGANYEQICKFARSADGTSKGFVAITSGGNLALYDNGGTVVATGSTTLSANTWYRIEFKTGASTTQAYELRIDGATELSGTYNAGADNFGSVLLGKPDNLNGQTVDFFYDDYLVDDAAFPGPGQCARLLPNADGTTMQWTAGVGASDFTSVDDAAGNDGDTTYVKKTTGTTQTALFNFESAATGGISGTINGVIVYTVVKKTTGTSACLARISSSGTTSDTSTNNLSTSYSALSKLATVDPNTSAAWTTGGIDAVQGGVSDTSSINAVRCTQVTLFVDFNPAAVETITVDKWRSNRPERPPTNAKSQPHLYQQPLSNPWGVTQPETITLDKWLSNRPVRAFATKAQPHLYQAEIPNPWVVAPPETITIDKWLPSVTRLNQILRRVHLHPKYFFNPFPVTTTLPSFPGDAIPNDFWVGAPSAWAAPIRWPTGESMSYRLDSYEVDNRPIRWKIANAPDGMWISSNGTIRWNSPVAGTYSGIAVTATRNGQNLTDFPSGTLSVTLTFNLAVNTTDFAYVATTGNDTTGDGSSGNPYLTVGKAASVINAGAVKDIIIKNGNYTESWSAGMWAGETFSASNFPTIRSQAGATVNFDVSGNAGFWLADTCQYAVIKGLTAHGATLAEGANFKIHGTHQIVSDCISYDAFMHADNNPTGVLLAGDDCIVNRVVSSNTTHSAGTNLTNISNFLIYNDAPNNGVKWLLNTKSYSSKIGIKIKHTNNSGSKSIVHRFECIGGEYGIMGAGLNSSFRYGVIYQPNTYGISVNKTDPSAYTVGAMLFEHIDVVGTSATCSNIWIESDYGTTGPLTFKRCISHQLNGAPSAGRGDVANARKHLASWIDTGPTISIPQSYPFYADYNNYYNSTSNSDAFQCGNNGAPVTYDFAGWQALTGTGITRDPNSFTTDPGFINAAGGNLNITPSSNAATSAGAGEYAGAFRPTQTYRTVGQSDTTLIEWDGVAQDPADWDAPDPLIVRKTWRAYLPTWMAKDPTTPSAAPETITLDKWAQPSVFPRRTPPRTHLRPGSNWGVNTPAGAGPETITVDKWRSAFPRLVRGASPRPWLRRLLFPDPMPQSTAYPGVSSTLWADTEVEIVRITLNKKDGSGTTTYEFAKDFWWPNSVYTGNGVTYPLLAESPRVVRACGVNVASRQSISVRLYAQSPLDSVNTTFADLLTTHDYHNGTMEIRYYLKPDGSTTTHVDSINIRQTVQIVGIQYSDGQKTVEIAGRDYGLEDESFGHVYQEGDFGTGVDDYINEYVGEVAPFVFGDSEDGTTGLVGSACPLYSSELVADGSGNTYQSIKVLAAIGVTGNTPTKGQLYIQNRSPDMDPRSWLPLSTFGATYFFRAPLLGPTALMTPAIGNHFSMQLWRMAHKYTPGTTARLIGGVTARMYMHGTIVTGAGQLQVRVQEAQQIASGQWAAVGNDLPGGTAVLDATALPGSVGDVNFHFPTPVLLVPNRYYFFILEWTNATDAANYPVLMYDPSVTSNPVYTNDQTVNKDGWAETPAELQMQIWDFGAESAYAGFAGTEGVLLETVRLDNLTPGVNPYVFAGHRFKVGSHGPTDDGTYTGTYGNRIENPLSVIHFLLADSTVGQGLDSSQVDYATISAIRPFADNFKVAGVIEAQTSVANLIEAICNQFRLRLMLTRRGKIYLEFPQAAGATFSLDVSEAVSRGDLFVETISETPESQLINHVDVAYLPDALNVNSDPVLARKALDTKYLGREYIHADESGTSIDDAVREEAAAASQALYGKRAALWRWDLHVRASHARKAMDYYFDRYHRQGPLVTVRVPRRDWYTTIDVFSKARAMHSEIPTTLGVRGEEPAKAHDGSGTPIVSYLDGIPITRLSQGEIAGEIQSCVEEGPFMFLTIEAKRSFENNP